MFELKLPVETLQVRGPLFAAGEVWLRLGGVEFPGAGWTDSPLSVFGSLYRAVEAALKGETWEAYFFDGPYFVKLIPVAAAPGSPHLVRIAGVCDRDEANPAVLADITIPFRDVVQGVNLTLQSLRAWAADEGDAEIQAMLLAMPYLPEPSLSAPASPC
ncbi:hypothetical protein [Streptomyces sp. FH025]|uniref:hypothetical protein n=1 Tax=Streptomyces sp. FH025 TaxID=2815937 RepID=UPI001A9E6D8C|nr:hypothetical protein [Streptomyces sp. FH025]MBO1415604.1 hypothetical protein [Streptomyces sp. FH025]